MLYEKAKLRGEFEGGSLGPPASDWCARAGLGGWREPFSSFVQQNAVFCSTPFLHVFWMANMSPKWFQMDVKMEAKIVLKTLKIRVLASKPQN